MSELFASELTARGRGGISVVQLEGEAALERVRALARGAELVPGRFAPGHFTIVRLCDRAGALLDEGLVLVESPARLELHLHGSPALVARVLAELGAVRAERCCSTLEGRAEELLMDAASEAAARMLLDQSRGALRRELGELRALTGPRFSERLGLLCARSGVARFLVRPPVVVLAGAVNAGKSTLFNVLVGRERAVVDAGAGTTRDAVRERTLLGEWAVELVDTAGARELSGRDLASGVEREGQALAARLRGDADLVLWLAGARAEPAPPQEARRGTLRVLTSRADELSGPERARAAAPISARYAPAEARSTVEALFHEALGLPRQPWSAGQGVPFAEDLAAALESWRVGGDEERARRGIEELLGPAS